MRLEGLDTETLTGYAKILASSTEWIEVNNFDDILDFIFQPEYKDAFLMTYNLQYDSDAMLKHLFVENSDNWREIAIKIQTDSYDYNDYKIRYIQNKLLTISYKRQDKRTFYDIAQYYEHSRLDDMAKMYLKDSKTDYAGWVNKCIEYDDKKIDLKALQKYFDDNTELIGKYCQQDASLTQRLSDFMESSFTMLNFGFSNPISMAKLAEIHQLRNYPYPRISKAMDHSHQFAKHAFHGGIFESRIRGYVDQEIFNYDKNSAYPYVLSTLEHLANGIFRWVEKPTKDSTYGWYQVLFDCWQIPYKRDIPYFQSFFLNGIEYQVQLAKDQTFYPVGVRSQIITKLELEFLKKNNYPYKVQGGLEWYKETDKYDKPFSWIEDAYKLRRDIKLNDKKDIRQLTLKKMYNSEYGKTAQQKHGYSRMTNFFYASWITSYMSTEISQIALDNIKNVIEIATDGIYCTKPIHNLNFGIELGEWEAEIYDKGLFLGSGMKQLYYTDDEGKKTYDSYFRGISNNRKLDIMSIIKKHKKESEIMFYKKRPIHMNECLIQVLKRDLYDLNTFQTIGRKLSVDTDKKHNWNIRYNNFKELLSNNSYASSLTIDDVNKYADKYKEVKI